MTGVYTITNKVNNKVYVGSTSKDLFVRIKTHLNELRRNDHVNKKLQHAFNKYGEDNFEFELLEESPPEYCVSLEQYWINMLDSVSNGYNLRSLAHSNLGIKYPQEVRKRLSEIHKGLPSHWIGRKHKPESIEKLRAAHLKENLSAETLAKMKKSQNERFRKNARPVAKVDFYGEIIETFPSESKAGKSMGHKNGSMIRNCISGKMRSSGGFLWVHNNNNIQESINKAIDRLYVKDKVAQYNLDNKFIRSWPSINSVIVTYSDKGAGRKPLERILSRNLEEPLFGFIWKNN